MARITVQASPSTGDHEVCLFADGENLIEVFGDKSIGLDPADLLIQPCPLAAGPSPREVLIGRCDCGVIGCGDVHVYLSSDAKVVTWTAPATPSIQRRFHAPSYHSEIARALQDHTWETSERTTARFEDEVSVELVSPVLALGAESLFLVSLEGREFSLLLDGDTKPIVGFFTHRIVAARDAGAAEQKARTAVLLQWQSRGYEDLAGKRPSLIIIDVERLQSRFRLRSGGGFTFHRGE